MIDMTKLQQSPWELPKGKTGTTSTGTQLPDWGTTPAFPTPGMDGPPSGTIPEAPWQRPDWFRAQTQPWGGWEEDYGGTPTSDQWFRDPSWGGHAVYNPEYGFQRYTDIGDFYQQQGWGANLSQAGLTPQMGSDWQSYGFTPKPSGGDVVGNGGDQTSVNWGDAIGQWQDWFSQIQQNQQPWAGGDTGGGQGGGQMAGTQGFNYPSQWGTASDVLTRFAQGLPTQQPWQWQQGSNIASQMAQTGMPTSYEPMYQQAKSITERDTQKAIQQAAEQAGLSGLRWSTPLGQTAQRIAGENMANLGLGFAGQEMGALEAARGRQMGGLGQLYQFGAGGAGLTEAAKGRGMQAAGGLTGLGAQYLQAPQDWAAQMYGMGGGMQQQGQTALDRYQQEYMRMAPEYNPWLQGAMGYFGTPTQMGYQQYQPSPISQIFGGLGAGASMGLGLCG